MTDKDRAIQTIEQLPATATFEQIMAELYVQRKVEQGLADYDAGRVADHQTVRERLAKWLPS